MGKLILLITKYWVYICFIIILVVGLYLRFNNAEHSISFGWDQARDAWKTRDIIMGQIVLNGPRTGVGHMYLGSLWYYYLAPFYTMTHLDPIAAIYANIFINIFNGIAIFLITRKIYNDKTALFVLLIYSTSNYLIEINRTAWNVSPIPGVSLLIFFGIYQIYQKSYIWIPIIMFLTGLFFHLHFAAFFILPILLVSLIFVTQKRKVLLLLLVSSPLFIMWLVPIIIYNVQTKGSNGDLLSGFIHNYYLGFHFRFLIHRLNDAFIQFQTVLAIPISQPILKFILPVIFAILVIFEKDKKDRLLGFLILVWFVIPLLGLTIYGGTTSEYYLLLNAPLVLYIIVYLQKKCIQLNPLISLSVFFILWSSFIFSNTKNIWIRPDTGGLAKQKQEAKESIQKGPKIEYNEGDIKSYLYTIWTEKK